MRRHNTDTLGKWATSIASGEEEIEEILRGVPGPMCPKIDGWAGSRYRRTTPGRRREYSDDSDGVDTLYEVAEQIESERDNAVEGLEECRLALDALRGALSSAIETIHAKNDEIRNLTADNHPEP